MWISSSLGKVNLWISCLSIYKLFQVFTEKEEQILIEYILKASKLFHGLTKLPNNWCTNLVQQRKKIPIIWNVQKVAGEHWLKEF